MGVVAEEKKLEYTREYERTNPAKLLEVLQKLFPAWNWKMLPRSNENDIFVQLYHNNPLYDSKTEEVPTNLFELLFHSIFFYMTSTGDDKLDWCEPPRLYYHIGSAERLLVTYLHRLRREGSDAEYGPVNNLVRGYFNS